MQQRAEACPQVKRIATGMSKSSRNNQIGYGLGLNHCLRFPSRWVGIGHLCFGMLAIILAGSDYVTVAQQPKSIAPASAAQTPPATVTPDSANKSKKSDSASKSTNQPSGDWRYRIGPGDLLEVRVFNRPQLSLDAVRVDGNGTIRLPLIESEIRAACRTEAELAQEVANQYREYQRNPQVFVFVKEYNSQPVAVIGAVEKPGRFQLQRRVRLLELLSLVGGPSDKAGLRIQVAHSGNDYTCDVSGQLTAADTQEEGFEVYTMGETLAGEPQSNPIIQPGDIVTVPEADQAFVVGNVFKPSVIPLKTPIRISEAIAMAGGVLPDSNINRVCIIRQVPGAPIKQEMFINLKEINQRRAEDVMLLAGDIVEVQALSGRKFLRSLLTSMGPALVNLPLLIVR